MRPIACPHVADPGDGKIHPPDEEETSCPAAPDDQPGHCLHWYDGEGCHRCGDPALPDCWVCGGAGEVPAI